MTRRELQSGDRIEFSYNGKVRGGVVDTHIEKHANIRIFEYGCSPEFSKIFKLSKMTKLRILVAAS